MVKHAEMSKIDAKMITEMFKNNAEADFKLFEICLSIL